MTHGIGQWVGQFDGALAGDAVLNIERRSPNRGFITVVQSLPLPPSRIDVEITWSGTQFKAESDTTLVFDTRTRKMFSADDYSKSNPDVFFPRPLRISGELRKNTLSGQWAGANSHQGTFTLINRFHESPSPPDYARMGWTEFKGFVSDYIKEGKERLYRGHRTNQWRLTTSFHREGRYDLNKYSDHEGRELVRRINALGGRRYDIAARGDDYGALLSLAQHHGFPTPLLDWTRSPYIAAFFAFEDVATMIEAPESVRIYMLDADQWARDTYQSPAISDPKPTVCVQEFEADGNPRHLPQQSVHIFTNVEDVEAEIRAQGVKNRQRYLTTIDMPFSERQHVMRELSFMGLTAANLYLGIDGVCRTLKERFFRW